MARYNLRMSNAPPIDLSAIPESQRAAVLALLQENGALKDANRRLEHLVAELNHVVHGKRSEKLSEDDRQLAFEDLETAVTEVEARKEQAAPSTTTPRRRRQRNLGHLPADLPRIERVIEPASLECPCGCGRMHRIGEDRTERLDIVPAQLRVLVDIRPKYACRVCSDGVTQAVAAPRLIQALAYQVSLIDGMGNSITEAVAAHLLESGEVRRHIRKTAPIYRARRDAFAHSLDAALGDWIDYRVPDGGLAFWLRFRDPAMLDRIEAGATDRGLSFADSHSYAVDETAERGLRLGFASMDEAEAREVLMTLRACVMA